jgi:hypothetical protein
MSRRSRKLAATAATAAIAVASPATAAKPTKQRSPLGGKPRVSTLATVPGGEAQQKLEVMRRAELGEHRRLLASALAAELPRAEAGAVERGLAAAEEDPAALAESLAGTTGASEGDVEEAFEAMARNARAARLRA